MIEGLNPLRVDELLRRELADDLGLAGDLTSDAVVDAEQQVVAVIRTREEGVLAGLPVALRAFELLDPQVVIERRCRDGEGIVPGQVVAEITGRARAVLAAERTALDLLGHLSGIATATRRYVDAVAGTGARIACTRKTTPGLRDLEKYAVRSGGGANHRFGLFDAVLIKDNHLALCGSVEEAVRRARSRVGHLVAIEVEVESLAQLDRALAVGVDAILLDNMDVATMQEAVRRAGGRAILEASGGVTLSTARAIAETGVTVISIGRLTHGTPSLDLGLDIDGG